MALDIKSCKLPECNNNLCRVCLTWNESNQSIFRPNSQEFTEANDFLEKLRLCGGLEIREDDGLPTSICSKCAIKLNDAHELRKLCQKTDLHLRELYGKIPRADSPKLLSVFTIDRSCQTDCTVTSIDSINRKDNAEYNRDDHILSLSLPYNRCSKRLSCKADQNAHSKLCDTLTQENAKINPDQASCDKVLASREPYRTRRMSVFKRVTSMENLRNHKERQRQYIKKSGTVNRFDTIENDGIDGRDGSHATYYCSECNGYYSSKKSLDKHELTHKVKQCRELHKDREKPKPVVCKICNKNFRKTDTMVRHLNVHKRANPKEVLSILKEIRENRRLENISQNQNSEKIATNSIRVAEDEEKVEGVGRKNDVEKGDVRTGNQEIEERIRIVDKDGEEKRDLENGRECMKRFVLHPSEATIGDESFLKNTVPHMCTQCDKRFASQKSLERHSLTHVQKRFICSVCNMKFFRQDRLNSHKSRCGHDEKHEKHSESAKPPDEKSAIKLINSWIREELDSDNEEKGFPCKTCGKSYGTRKSLLKHRSIVHDTQDEECCKCGKTCNCTDKRKTRERPCEKSKPYSCDVCNKSFEKEVKLQRHARMHERAKEQQDVNFKRFLCHVCSKTFRQNTGLMFHMRTHTGYKPHVCKYCGRGFTSNSNCINHERTHTGDRPFVCHFCSAAFAKSCTLKAHITTHTGEANYHCKTCGKSFRRLKYLKEHRFTHTGEKPYACKICGTAYSHSGSLFVHEKKCKAQYNNYPPNSYSQTQNSSAFETPSLAASSVQPHLNNFTPAPLQTGHLAKSYLNVVQRMNCEPPIPSPLTGQIASSIIPSMVPTTDLHLHSNSDISSTTKNFPLIGQIFHS